MEFRELSLDDFDQIAKLQRAYKTSIGESIPKKDGLERLKGAMEKGYIRFFGCLDGETLIGSVSITRAFSTFNYEELGLVEDIYVVSSYRHKGIARGLINYLTEQKICPALGLFCGDENVEIFHSLGFTFPIENTLLKI